MYKLQIWELLSDLLVVPFKLSIAKSSSSSHVYFL